MYKTEKQHWLSSNFRIYIRNKNTNRNAIYLSECSKLDGSALETTFQSQTRMRTMIEKIGEWQGSQEKNKVMYPLLLRCILCVFFKKKHLFKFFYVFAGKKTRIPPKLKLQNNFQSKKILQSHPFLS